MHVIFSPPLSVKVQRTTKPGFSLVKKLGKRPRIENSITQNLQADMPFKFKIPTVVGFPTIMNSKDGWLK